MHTAGRLPGPPRGPGTLPRAPQHAPTRSRRPRAACQLPAETPRVRPVRTAGTGHLPAYLGVSRGHLDDEPFCIKKARSHATADEASVGSPAAPRENRFRPGTSRGPRAAPGPRGRPRARVTRRGTETRLRGTRLPHRTLGAPSAAQLHIPVRKPGCHGEHLGARAVPRPAPAPRAPAALLGEDAAEERHVGPQRGGQGGQAAEGPDVGHAVGGLPAGLQRDVAGCGDRAGPQTLPGRGLAGRPLCGRRLRVSGRCALHIPPAPLAPGRGTVPALRAQGPPCRLLCAPCPETGDPRRHPTRCHSRAPTRPQVPTAQHGVSAVGHTGRLGGRSVRCICAAW